MNNASSSEILGDSMTKVGLGILLLFIVGLIFIELGRDEGDRSGVGGAAGAGSGAAVTAFLVE